MSLPLLAGVDVGGTKVAVGITDGTGRIVATRRESTTRKGGNHVVAQIISLLDGVIREAGAEKLGVMAIGIAVPAVIDQKRGAVLWAPNVPGWQHEAEVCRPVGEALGVPVSLHYDGHAWVVGEWWCGAARGTRDAALIAVGTGIGGGLILDGRLHRGRIGVAGAIGWWLLDWHGASAGRRAPAGWLESIASGPAIARAAGKPTSEEALRAAREGDAAARAAIAQAAEVLGVTAANVASMIDPEVIVLAGGVITGAADLLLPRIREIASREAQPQVARVLRVVPAELGEDAAWLGAARLAQLRAGEEIP